MAARKNNAYDSKAAGIRILGGRITTTDEATALTLYGYDKVGVYSCSWRPRDNGQTMNAPKNLVRKAFSGINNGRQGKGSIYVFASGNGGRHEDQCNFDGYTNNIYSVTVGAVDHTGRHPTYLETCAANMIIDMAYSSGSGKRIVCYLSFTINWFFFAPLITLR